MPAAEEGFAGAVGGRNWRATKNDARACGVVGGGRARYRRVGLSSASQPYAR